MATLDSGLVLGGLSGLYMVGGCGSLACSSFRGPGLVRRCVVGHWWTSGNVGSCRASQEFTGV